LRGLTTSVILHERIETTVTRAKAVRPQVERVITLAKRDTLHARRQAAAYLFEPRAVQKLFDNIGPRFADRAGGYTRIVRLGPRRGDGAETAILELLGTRLAKKAEGKKKRREARMRKQSDETQAGSAGRP
jgi:large subunit ribosomal protein L17